MKSTYGQIVNEAMAGLPDRLTLRKYSAMLAGDAREALTVRECAAEARIVAENAIPTFGSDLMDLVYELPAMLYEEVDPVDGYDTPIGMFRRALVRDLFDKLEPAAEEYCRNQFGQVDVGALSAAAQVGCEFLQVLMEADADRPPVGDVHTTREAHAALRRSLDEFSATGSRRAYEEMVTGTEIVGMKLSMIGDADSAAVGRHMLETATAAAMRPEAFRPRPVQLRVVA